jgi:NAD(P)-dependent dehydrogenase (short-subunit alcohol dehydrogenase family)
MSNRLENKVAVVTGGTSGIGLATAQRFALEGAKVFVTGRREKELTSAVEQIGHGAVAVQGDVSKVEPLGVCRA